MISFSLEPEAFMNYWQLRLFCML